MVSYLTSPYFSIELTNEHHTGIVKPYYKFQFALKFVNILNNVLPELDYVCLKDA